MDISNMSSPSFFVWDPVDFAGFHVSGGWGVGGSGAKEINHESNLTSEPNCWPIKSVLRQGCSCHGSDISYHSLKSVKLYLM